MVASSTVVSAGGRRRVDRPAVDTRGLRRRPPEVLLWGRQNLRLQHHLQGYGRGGRFGGRAGWGAGG